MKLNPFSKKSTAYYSKVKAEYDKLHRELTDARAELQQAEADAERKQRRKFELNQRGSIYSSTHEETKASIEASAASNFVHTVKGKIGQLESQIAPLQRIAQAPDKFAEAQQSLEGLITQKATLTREQEKTDVLIAKVSKRIAELNGRIGAETQSATESMLSGEGEFVVPEALTRLETELRLGNTSLAELRGKRETLAAQLKDLPKSIREAQRIFVAYRADMVETELYEQLTSVMNLFARASAARRQHSYHHDECRFEIEIPRELIESAQTVLAAELPTD